MYIIFLENVFVREDFLSTVKKTSNGKYTGVWGHSSKSLLLEDFRDIENLKLSLHLINI